MNQVQRVRDWLGQALPLWAADSQGSFVEYLAPDGHPDLGAPRRTMVQARQIYVYSQAARLGLMRDGLGVAGRAFAYLLQHGAPEGAHRGIVHSLDGHGGVLDSTRDLYGHAFLLLAFSGFYGASGDFRAKQAMDDMIRAIDMLRHPSGLGYREDSAGRLPRRQNPHMHLLEAYLAAHAATGSADMLERARAMVELFEKHFFAGGRLLEFFTEDLTPAPPPNGDVVEPGHHLQWVWLLKAYGRASGRDMSGAMQSLYETAASAGTETASGLLYNEIWRDGGIKDAAKRLWPQTEQVKADLALGLSSANKALDRLFRYFLDPAPPGLWIERLDAKNAPLMAPVPASSLYHVFLAFSEYLGP
jgi:mannose-6-phosphate isomerase